MEKSYSDFIFIFFNLFFGLCFPLPIPHCMHRAHYSPSPCVLADSFPSQGQARFNHSKALLARRKQPQSSALAAMALHKFATRGLEARPWPPASPHTNADDGWKILPLETSILLQNSCMGAHILCTPACMFRCTQSCLCLRWSTAFQFLFAFHPGLEVPPDCAWEQCRAKAR